MGALALCRRQRQLNWGLSFNNRCCIRPSLSQSACSLFGKRNPYRGDQGSSQDSEIFIRCQIFVSLQGWNICTDRAKQRLNTPVGRRPLLAASSSSSVSQQYRRLSKRMFDWGSTDGRRHFGARLTAAADNKYSNEAQNGWLAFKCNDLESQRLGALCV